MNTGQRITRVWCHGNTEVSRSRDDGWWHLSMAGRAFAMHAGQERCGRSPIRTCASRVTTGGAKARSRGLACGHASGDFIQRGIPEASPALGDCKNELTLITVAMQTKGLCGYAIGQDVSGGGMPCMTRSYRLC